MNPYVVIDLGGGRASLCRAPDPKHQPVRELKVVAEGSMTAVTAAANLVARGEWDLVSCITPNGRLDGHGSYVKDGACAFCAKPLTSRSR